jgi:hypothetical protein
MKNRVRQLVEEKVEDPEFRFSKLTHVELYVYHLVQEKEIRERTFRHESKPDSTWVEFTRDGKLVEANEASNSDAASSNASIPETSAPESSSSQATSPAP